MALRPTVNDTRNAIHRPLAILGYMRTNASPPNAKTHDLIIGGTTVKAPLLYLRTRPVTCISEQLWSRSSRRKKQTPPLPMKRPSMDGPYALLFDNSIHTEENEENASFPLFPSVESGLARKITGN